MADAEDRPSRQPWGQNPPRAGSWSADHRDRHSREVRLEVRWSAAGDRAPGAPGGDYAAIVDEAVVAVVERKTLENLATSLSDGGLAFQMQRLAAVARAAIVVEGDYPDLFRTQPGRGSWLADMLGRLAVRYPEVPVIFAGSRRFAEEWAYRFLGAAAADRVESP